MDLVFVTEGRFVRHSDGKVYSVGGGFNNLLWNRYLRFFEKIKVVGRVLEDDDYGAKEADLASRGEVTFVDLPYYVGPVEYLKVRQKIKKKLHEILMPGYAYICRVPGQIGGMAAAILARRKIPYGVEVVGDPWDVFAPGSIKHVLRPLFRHEGRKVLRKVVKNASAALYVTNKKLQARYPVRKGIFQIGVSDVKVNAAVVPVTFHVLATKPFIFKVISVGSLEQMYKAPDVVLKAVKLLRDRGINCDLMWLGDGRFRNEMIALAENLGISPQVHFVGNVSSQDVLHYLLDSDLFLSVSRTEGLPRALVEAMAMGLPCIGSNVGGIPELLEESVIVEKGRESDLADKIELMYRDIAFTNQQAERNFEEAKNYYDEVLDKKRVLFFEELKRISI